MGIIGDGPLISMTLPEYWGVVVLQNKESKTTECHLAEQVIENLMTKIKEENERKPASNKMRSGPGF